MAAGIRALIALVLAGVAAVGCALSWFQVRSTVAVAPVADGQPVTASVVYDPPLLLLTLLLAAAAGVLAAIGVAGVWRSRHSPADTP